MVDASAYELIVRQRLADSVAVGVRMLEGAIATQMAAVAIVMVEAYRAGKKALFFGNGGSAADAQHLAAEFLGRYLLDRASLPAVALSDNAAALTAIGNDYDFSDVFARQVEGVGAPGDVALGLSTSGKSENVVRALESASDHGLVTVGLTGAAGGRVKQAADHCLCVPSEETARIQEGHMLIGHTLCELVERELFAEPER